MSAILAIILTLRSMTPTTALIDYAAEAMGQNAAYCQCIAYHESRYDVNAVGALGERGLFQILPSTGDWIAEQWGLQEYDAFDPATNTMMAMWLLKEGHHEWFSTHGLCAHHLEE